VNSVQLSNKITRFNRISQFHVAPHFAAAQHKAQAVFVLARCQGGIAQAKRAGGLATEHWTLAGFAVTSPHV
jgi:hypothetical protein